MSTPIVPEPAEPNDPVVVETPAPVPAPASANPDPITGEPGAHPVGVGVGALGAGAAGAALGSIGGPIGMLIGAAIGAVAGGLAGKEVATNDAAAVDEAPSGTNESAVESSFGSPSLLGEDSDGAEGVSLADEVSSTQGHPSAVSPAGGEEAVRMSAYYHFLHRTSTGGQGDALEDWLAAEREMMFG